MTKVPTSIFSTISSPKAARFAGNWLAGAAESRSARRRLNAILRLACRTLGLKRGKGLGMLGIAAALAIGLASPAIAQTVSPVVASSPDMGTPPSPAGVIRLEKGFTFLEATLPNRVGLYDQPQMSAFTINKGAVVSGKLTANGVQVPTGAVLQQDYFMPAGVATQYSAGTTIDGPVTITPGTGLPVAIRFPVGTIIPLGTRMTSGVLPDWVQPGVPTVREFAISKNTLYNSNMHSGGAYSTLGWGMAFPAAGDIAEGRDLRFTQLKVNTDANSKPAMTSTNIAGDIALGSGATATGENIAANATVPATVAPATAVGDAAKATKGGAVAVGSGANASAQHAIAIGTNAKADKSSTGNIGAIAIGNDALATNGGTSLGAMAEAVDGGFAAGASAKASGASGVAIGEAAKVTGDGGVAIGARADTVKLGFAAGASAKVTGIAGAAVGAMADAVESASAFGVRAKATGESSTALGENAQASNNRDVALGAGSQTDKAVGTSTVVVDGVSYNLAGISPDSTVSVGIKGKERTLTNLAAGRIAADSTDAVNGSELFATNEAVKAQGTRLTTAEGTIKTQGETLVTQGGQIDTLDTAVKAQGTRLTTAEGTIKTYGETLVTQGGQIDTLDTAVKAQGTRLTTAEGTIKTHGETLVTQGGQIGTLDTTVKAQDTRLTAAEGTVKSQGDTLVTVTKDIATQGGKISVLDNQFLQFKVRTDANSKAAALGTPGVLGDMALGTGATATGSFNASGASAAIAVGDNAAASKGGSIAVGSGAAAEIRAGIAIGASSKATATNGTAGAIAIGEKATATNSGVSLGIEAVGQGTAATALGLGTSAGDRSTAVGANAKALQELATSVGVSSEASKRAAALGVGAKATGESSLALGDNAKASNFASIAIGNTAVASHEGSIAIGDASSTEDMHIVGSEHLNGITYKTYRTQYEAGVVSFGHQGLLTRQIVNVAAGAVGATSTDVINGAQLFVAYDAIERLGRQSLQYVPTVDTNGDQKIDATDAIDYSQLALKPNVDGTGTVIGTKLSNLADGVAANDAVNVGQLDKLKSELNAGSTGLVQQKAIKDSHNDKLAVGEVSTATVVDFTGKAPKLDDKGQPVLVDGKQVLVDADRVLTGVAAGTVDKTSNQAVNGKQLYELDKRAVKYAWNDKNKDGILDEGEIETSDLKLEENVDASGKVVGTRLGNVADGAITSTSLDAINGRQLHSAANALAGGLGGGAGFDANGKFVAPAYQVNSYSLNGTATTSTASNVGDTLAALSGNDQMFNDRFSGLDAKIDYLNKHAVFRTGSEPASPSLPGGALADDPIPGQNNPSTGPGKITDVADGLVAPGSKEAVNGGQLYVVDEKVNVLGDTVSKALDVNDPASLAGKTAAVTTKLGDLEKKAVTYDTASDGTKKNQLTLQGGDLNAPVLIKNVAEGKDDSDAANVAQVKKSSEQAKSYTDDTATKTLEASKSYTNSVLTIVDNLPSKESVMNLQTAVGGLDKKINDNFNQLSSDISSVRSEARQAAAVGLAASSLRFDNTPGKLSVAMGGAVWRDEGAMAFGAGYTSESGKVRANLTGATSDGNFGVAGGISFTLN
ncbi:YadA-like family protein [Phyllobacterium sp. SB3]|uniref:YadA-like family protein n=1 Tax=Phyllobacterium sp. SB3 TaxID=3156073 RepID=UPI0032AEF0EE